MDIWPNGQRRALTQREHKQWNATHYPGTRQLCCECHAPTGRCEEDAIYTDDGLGPLCETCLMGADKAKEQEKQ